MVQIAMDITMHMDVLLIVIVVFFILLIVALLFSDIFRTDLKAIFLYGRPDNSGSDLQHYKNTEISAGRMQFFCQKLVFICLTTFLIFKGGVEVVDTFYPFDASSHEILAHIKEIKTLSYVAKALAISCGLQLAFMLITKGPDEAVEPIMLGVASVILLMLSAIDPDKWTVYNSLSVAILVLCIAGLYFLSKKLDNEKNKQ